MPLTLWELLHESIEAVGEWKDAALNIWTIFCLSAFVCYSLWLDKHTRERRKLVIECDETENTTFNNGSTSSIVEHAIARIPSSISCTSGQNLNGKSNSEFVETDRAQSEPLFNCSRGESFISSFNESQPRQPAKVAFEHPVELEYHTSQPQSPSQGGSWRSSSTRSSGSPFRTQQSDGECRRRVQSFSVPSVSKLPTSVLNFKFPTAMKIRLSSEAASPTGSEHEDNSSFSGHPRVSNLSYVKSSEDDTLDIALKRDECSICFVLLNKEPVSICANDQGFPTCLHIYHDRCLKALRRRRCIICDVPFRFRRKLPDLEANPEDWFESVDLDQSGGLTVKEVARVLAAQFPIDRVPLESLLEHNWRKWDKDNTGEIDLSEFFVPKTGLLAFLKKNRTAFMFRVPEVEPPDIRDDAKAWFEYFDNDNSGGLEKTEVLRGLIVSFGLSKDATICLNLRKVLNAIWPIFDSDNDQHISKEEFLEPKLGLATSIIESLSHRRRKVPTKASSS